MLKRIHRRVKHSDQVPSSTLKGMTFDRKTFVECSQRMMIRFAPTLKRPKSDREANESESGSSGTSTSHVSLFSNTDSSSTRSTPDAAVGKVSDAFPSSSRQGTDGNISSSDDDEDFPGDRVVEVIDTGTGTGTSISTLEQQSKVTMTPKKNATLEIEGQGANNYNYNRVEINFGASTARMKVTRTNASSTLPPNLHLSDSETSERKRPIKGTSSGGTTMMRQMFLKPFNEFASLMAIIGDNLDMAAYPTP